ncbi:hypothetical protein K439DRAFT_1637046 [Ramaria rubella]|nr:hypothetical protein K439DRAFT_1637046 [Ramaria rubella]
MPPDIRINGELTLWLANHQNSWRALALMIQHPTLSLTRKDVHWWQQQAPPASKVLHTAPTVFHHRGRRASCNPANAL